MTLYDGSKKIHHWFPKVNHMVDDYLDYNDTPDTVIVGKSPRSSLYR